MENEPAIETWPVHRGIMRGSLWKCSQLQCKLATTEESRGLEIQNQLLDDVNEFQEFPGRQVHTDVEREGIPPSDADCPPAAPVVQEEEDRTSALIPAGTSRRECTWSVRHFQPSGQ